MLFIWLDTGDAIELHEFAGFWRSVPLCPPAESVVVYADSANRSLHIGVLRLLETPSDIVTIYFFLELLLSD